MTTDVDPNTITQATAAIVSAWISRAVPTDYAQVDAMIGSVRRALTAPIEDPEPTPVELVPAVPINKSVHDDFIICLEDGEKFKSLKRHLRTRFNLTPEEYRAKWGLPASYPMVAPSYSATRSKLAKASGLGVKS